jgi:hypothetical protein
MRKVETGNFIAKTLQNSLYNYCKESKHFQGPSAATSLKHLRKMHPKLISNKGQISSLDFFYRPKIKELLNEEVAINQVDNQKR